MKLAERDKKYIKRILYILVLGLSLGLIVYISIDTFTGVNFLENKNYMTFQLWVCIVFMIDFFVELFLAEDKWKYVRHPLVFLSVVDTLSQHHKPLAHKFFSGNALFHTVHTSRPWSPRPVDCNRLHDRQRTVITIVVLHINHAVSDIFRKPYLLRT